MDRGLATVPQLLGCPRGRFFAANVGYLCSDEEQVSLHFRPRTHDAVLAVLDKVDVRAVAALPEADLLDALGLAVDFARYWQPPDEEDLLFAHPDVAAALRPIAQARARIRPVRVHSTPRVYEIGGPADWAHPVDTYPFPVPASRRSEWYYTTGEHLDWFIPDWVAVAADFDAVHLTVHGYLSTPGVAIPLVANSGATVLAGWDPDATFWLRDGVITIDDEPTEWRRTSDRPWAPEPNSP
ncbi:hypothetical protein DEU38_106189 [Rhodococcus sp. AG1013]|uniref:hypothetical protein n=1 Tax=Rhodococcus sp. AG1013 TaxID=2183996 RepID=UPI000E0AB0F4|nr:hypothetical protein [Rhodococcus sp. AG1013]RDI30374.1 hypothetical protein DEU38_106189 [Rhodococcus sp. AG1013]